jgi:hypothetical protein
MAVAAREKVLCAQDPSRKRHYSMNGREFTFDAEKKQMVYVDTPSKVLPFEMVAVEGRLERDKKKTLSKSKKRGMDM